MHVGVPLRKINLVQNPVVDSEETTMCGVGRNSATKVGAQANSSNCCSVWVTILEIYLIERCPVANDIQRSCVGSLVQGASNDRITTRLIPTSCDLTTAKVIPPYAVRKLGRVVDNDNHFATTHLRHRYINQLTTGGEACKN